MAYYKLNESQKFLEKLFSLVKSSSRSTLRSSLHFIPVVAEQTSTGRFATQTLASPLKRA